MPGAGGLVTETAGQAFGNVRWDDAVRAAARREVPARSRKARLRRWRRTRRCCTRRLEAGRERVVIIRCRSIRKPRWEVSRFGVGDGISGLSAGSASRRIGGQGAVLRRILRTRRGTRRRQGPAAREAAAERGGRLGAAVRARHRRAVPQEPAASGWEHPNDEGIMPLGVFENQPNLSSTGTLHRHDG